MVFPLFLDASDGEQQDGVVVRIAAGKSSSSDKKRVPDGKESKDKDDASKEQVGSWLCSCAFSRCL